LFNADPNYAPTLGVLDPRQTTWIVFSGHLDPNGRGALYNSYAQQWSLGIQREIGRTVAEARYVGTRGVGLYTLVEANPRASASSSTSVSPTPTPTPSTSLTRGKTTWRVAPSASPCA